MAIFVMLRPCAEGVRLDIETAIAVLTCLIVAAGVQILPRLTCVIMLMGNCQLREGVADLTVRISCHIAIDGVEAVFIEAVALRYRHRDGNGVGRCAKLAVRHLRSPFRCVNGEGAICSGSRGRGSFAVFRGSNRQRNTVDLVGSGCIGCLVSCEDTISSQIIRMILSISAICNRVGNIIRLCNGINAIIVTKFQPYCIEIRLIRLYRTSYWFAENVFVYGGRKLNIIRKGGVYKLGCREALTDLVIQRRQLNLDLQTGSDNSIILQLKGSDQSCCSFIKIVTFYSFSSACVKNAIELDSFPVKLKPIISLKGHSAFVDSAAFKRSYSIAVLVLPINARHRIIFADVVYPFCRSVVAGAFAVNRAAWRSRHKLDFRLCTSNPIPTDTLVLIKSFIVFQVMRLFCLCAAATCFEMILFVVV